MARMRSTNEILTNSMQFWLLTGLPSVFLVLDPSKLTGQNIQILPRACCKLPVTV